MEEEIKKLIEKYEIELISKEARFGKSSYAAFEAKLIVDDFKSLLKFKKENCCAKEII